MSDNIKYSHPGKDDLVTSGTLKVSNNGIVKLRVEFDDVVQNAGLFRKMGILSKLVSGTSSVAVNFNGQSGASACPVVDLSKVPYSAVFDSKESYDFEIDMKVGKSAAQAIENSDCVIARRPNPDVFRNP